MWRYAYINFVSSTSMCNGIIKCISLLRLPFSFFFLISFFPFLDELVRLMHFSSSFLEDISQRKRPFWPGIPESTLIIMFDVGLVHKKNPPKKVKPINEGLSIWV